MPEELAERGFRLSCNGYPVSDELKVVFNVKQLAELDDLILPPGTVHPTVTPGRPGFWTALRTPRRRPRRSRPRPRVTLAGEELDFPLAEASGGDVGAGRQLGGALGHVADGHVCGRPEV